MNMPRILLVDDDPALLRLLTEWLQSAGYEVQQAADGNEAIEAIRRKCPHILITDWQMPNLDGFQLCRWLRVQELENYVYALLLTAYGGAENAVAGLDSGADDFLVKPIKEKELLARLGAATRMLELESGLKQLAGTDPMTGLMTQPRFYRRAEKEWKRALRHDRSLTCVMFDLDFFKRINDTHGHAAGNEVIRRVADILKDNCRATDLVARYGGEEFCALLPETDERQGMTWAERLRRIVAATRIPVGSQQLRITISAGVAQRLADTNDPNELVDMADQALLLAKRSGRDCVVGTQAVNQSLPMISSGTSPNRLLNGLTARDVMTTLMASLHQEDSVVRSAMYLLAQRINSAPVVDDEGKLVGILSEKDIMAIVLWPNWWTTQIKDVMKPNVVCYEEETPMLSIYDFLCRVSIRRVIVVKNNRPTGIISRGSLLRWFVNSVVDESAEIADALTEPCASVFEKLRQCLSETAKAISDQASMLEHRINDQQADLVPSIVGDASRIQDLVNDLLGYSRFAQGGTSEGDIHLLFPDLGRFAPIELADQHI